MVSPAPVHEPAREVGTSRCDVPDRVRAGGTNRAARPCHACIAPLVRAADGAARRYVFTVAQIFNLPYRRFVIGRAPIVPKTADFANDPQVANLRYSVARPSRNQTLSLLHRMEERAGERRFFPLVKLGCPSPQSSPHSRVVGRGRRQAHGEKSSRLATISTDTDRLQVCATTQRQARVGGS